MRAVTVPASGRRLGVAAVLTWLGVVIGGSAGPGVCVAAIGAAAWGSRRHLAAWMIVPGVVAGWAAAGPAVHEAWNAGPGPHALTLASDPVAGRWDALAFAVVDGRIPVAVRLPIDYQAMHGDRLVVRGSSDGRAGVVRGRPVAATIRVVGVLEHSEAAEPLLRSANRMRSRMLGEIEPGRSNARGLLAGFLIGDVSAVDPVVLEDLRLSGLSHLVAVSGSNVALFLGLWWMVTAPLSVSPRWRALVGAVGLVVFGHLTRWEPSVVRASAMALVALVGRSLGLVIDAWSALALAVIGSLLAAPALAGSLGFQLSAAATAGILLVPRIEGAVARTMAMTAGAQLAVTPLLLTAFGSVPIFSPIANLVAIPVVAASTVAGGLGGILGADPLVGAAAAGAEVVIAVGRVGAELPQVGWSAVLGAALLLACALARPGWRPALSLAAAGALVLAVVPGGRSFDPPAAVFLDVGQGDAALVVAADLVVLIDGGPDPALLEEALRRHRVDRIDVMVATHVHADHLNGLVSVLARHPVGEVWQAFEPHETGASRALTEEAARVGVRVRRPEVGAKLTGTDVAVTVAGPLRRYDSANDQSIVLIVDLGGTRIAFPGDVETFAQAEIEIGQVDVLKVPHQGAATSDRGWLERHAGSLAVISVGPNDYGHPSQAVVDALREAGARVIRTDEWGDVVVRPGPQLMDARRPRSRWPVRPGRRSPRRLRGWLHGRCEHRRQPLSTVQRARPQPWRPLPDRCREGRRRWWRGRGRGDGRCRLRCAGHR